MGKLGVIAEIYPQIQSIANRKDKLAMIEEKIGMDRGQYYWNRRKMALHLQGSILRLHDK